MLRLLGGIIGGTAATFVGRILASDTSPLDPTSPSFWVSFGIAGIVSFAFVKEWVVPGPTHRREVKAREVAEMALRETAPALGKAAEALERLLEERRGPKGGR